MYYWQHMLVIFTIVTQINIIQLSGQDTNRWRNKTNLNPLWYALLSIWLAHLKFVDNKLSYRGVKKITTRSHEAACVLIILLNIYLTPKWLYQFKCIQPAICYFPDIALPHCFFKSFNHSFLVLFFSFYCLISKFKFFVFPFSLFPFCFSFFVFHFSFLFLIFCF